MTDPTRPGPAKPGAARIREINDTIRYAMWSVFAVAEPLADEDRGALATEVEELFTDLAARDVVVRGTYDVAGLRADADVMVWWHAETIEALQEAYHALLRTEYGQHLDPVWSVAALHRPAVEGFDRTLPLERRGGGVYAGVVSLPFAGQWDARITARQDADSHQATQRLFLP